MTICEPEEITNCVGFFKPRWLRLDRFPTTRSSGSARPAGSTDVHMQSDKNIRLFGLLSDPADQKRTGICLPVIRRGVFRKEARDYVIKPWWASFHAAIRANYSARCGSSIGLRRPWPSPNLTFSFSRHAEICSSGTTSKCPSASGAKTQSRTLSNRCLERLNFRLWRSLTGRTTGMLRQRRCVSVAWSPLYGNAYWCRRRDSNPRPHHYE